MSNDNSFSSTWTQDLLTEVMETTQRSVLQWCNVVTKTGLSRSLQEEWTEIFKHQVAEIYKDMIDEATESQNKIISQIEVLLTKLESICKQLHLKMPQHGSESLSLTEEYQLLEKRLDEYEKIFQKRQKEVSNLIKEQNGLCQALGRTPKVVPLSPLATTEVVDDLKRYIEILESEKFERLETFLHLKSKILEIAAALNYKPNLDFEKMVLSRDDSEFAVTDENMAKLNEFFESLKSIKEKAESDIAAARERINELWEILSVDIQYSQNFLSQNIGCNLDVLESLNAEIKRCEILKKENIKKFVEKLRSDLIIWWDKCHFTDQERQSFIYMDTDLYTEDLLTLHDLEIQKVKKHYNTNHELYLLLEKRKVLWIKMLSLEGNVASKDRYKNRGGQLLQEEKERNILAKQIPSIEKKLIELTEEFIKKNGCPFTSWGKSVETIISDDYNELNDNKKLKLSAHKHVRERTPLRLNLGLTRSTSTLKLTQLTPNVTSSKRKLNFTPSCSAKRSRPLKDTCSAGKLRCHASSSKGPRFSTERSKKERRRRISQKSVKKYNENIEPLPNSEYSFFEKDMEKKEGCRSTLFKADSLGDLVSNLPQTPQQKSTLQNRLRSPCTVPKLSTAPSLKLRF